MSDKAETASTWTEVMAPHVQRFEVASAVGGSAVYNAEGSKAMAVLIRDMAAKLDRAIAFIEQKGGGNA